MEARRDRGVGLERVAKELKISFRYLSALENNKFSDLPGKVYLKSFLRQYCDYLDLDFKDCWRLVKDFRANTIPTASSIKKKHFLSWPEYIRRALLILAVIGILFFLGWRVKEIFNPPPLEIIQPPDGSTVSERRLEIIGRSRPEIEIVINRKTVFVDEQGEFRAEVDLQKGLNLIKITAKKRYSRPREKELRILFKKEN